MAGIADQRGRSRLSYSLRMRCAPLLLVAFVLACSSDPERSPDAGSNSNESENPNVNPNVNVNVVRKAIGPEGGTIVVQGATMTIPKGALAETTNITVSAIDTAALDEFVVLSKLFVCEPSGTSFAQPVTMEMPFTDDGQPKSMWWSSGADPNFQDLGGEARDGKMQATVMHFSAGFVGRKK